MSFFGEGTEGVFGRVTLVSALRDIFKVVKRAKWKVKIIMWDPATEEEWEITPAGSRQTKRPRIYVEVTAKPVNREDEQG